MSDADPLRTAGGSPMQFSYKRSRMPYQHPHTTPSERTGPPRSISFNSLPNPCLVSRSNSHAEGVRPPTEMTSVAAGSSTQQNQNHNVSRFRDALEYEDPDQREREREHLERVERRKFRDGRSEERNPAKRHTDRSRETPKEERPPFELGAVSEGRTGRRSKLTYPLGARPDDREELMTAPKWGWLRPLPDVIAQSHSQTSPAGGSSALARGGVNVTDELTTGGLATLMLKLWFERDEKGHRRVPILLHRLRIRISDGLHPLDGNKAVFGIECEYPNGGARWVIYRELKEFISLHTHYALSNAYNRNIEALPEFPKTSLPYLKFLKKEGREKGIKVGHAEFTRMQREGLENYLVGLIRAVMFHSAVNRLAGFLEISALSISLAQSGGIQYKAGFLHLEISEGIGLGSKSARRKKRHLQKWCAVRESYLC